MADERSNVRDERLLVNKRCRPVSIFGLPSEDKGYFSAKWIGKSALNLSHAGHHG